MKGQRGRKAGIKSLKNPITVKISSYNAYFGKFCENYGSDIMSLIGDVDVV